MPYSLIDTGVIWANSDLRNWLNTEFMDSAFSEEEKDEIIEMTIESNCYDNGTVIMETNSTIDFVSIPSDDDWVKRFSEVQIYDDWWFNPTFSIGAKQKMVSRVDSEISEKEQIGWWERDTYYYGNVNREDSRSYAGAVYMAGWTSVDVVNTIYGVRPMIRIRR